MFETNFADVADQALVASIEQVARDENQATARRLAAIAELVFREVDEDDERGGWAVDPWDHTAARVAAALNIGQRRASAQMRIAVALRVRLPKVAALCMSGQVSGRVISEVTWRTQLVDEQVMPLVDEGLAKRVAGFGPLSERALIRSIDAVVSRHDPDAVRRTRQLMRDRDFRVGGCDDPDATATVWGRLLAHDGAALQARIAAMAAQVCPDDPRSEGERRSDAAGAWAHGNEHLACRCGSPQCTAATPSRSNVVIRVIADPAAVNAAQALLSEDEKQETVGGDEDAAEKSPNEQPELQGGGSCDDKPSAAVAKRRDGGVAILSGRGRVLPIAVLAEAIRSGAQVKPLWTPGSDPEPQYRPSVKLAEWVRTRDLHCRFPGCDVPADRCDLDHTKPWPLGPTHPSNLSCKCRIHHLLKTFWGGAGGWVDEQFPGGTMRWLAPDGRTYTTVPGSRLLFPTWDTTTADLVPPPTGPPPSPARSMMMPRRRRRRAAEEAARTAAERAANRAELARPYADAVARRPFTAKTASNDDPPPSIGL